MTTTQEYTWQDKMTVWAENNKCKIVTTGCGRIASIKTPAGYIYQINTCDEGFRMLDDHTCKINYYKTVQGVMRALNGRKAYLLDLAREF